MKPHRSVYKLVVLSLPLAFRALNFSCSLSSSTSFFSCRYHHSPVQNELSHGFPFWSARAASICCNRVSSQEPGSLLYKGYHVSSVRNSFAKQLHTSLLDILIVTNKASACWDSSFWNGAHVAQWVRKEMWVLPSSLLFPFHIWLFQKLSSRKKK